MCHSASNERPNVISEPLNRIARKVASPGPGASEPGESGNSDRLHSATRAESPRRRRGRTFPDSSTSCRVNKARCALSSTPVRVNGRCFVHVRRSAEGESNKTRTDSWKGVKTQTEPSQRKVFPCFWNPGTERFTLHVSTLPIGRFGNNHANVDVSVVFFCTKIHIKNSNLCLSIQMALKQTSTT